MSISYTRTTTIGFILLLVFRKLYQFVRNLYVHIFHFNHLFLCFMCILSILFVQKKIIEIMGVIFGILERSSPIIKLRKLSFTFYLAV